MSSLVIIGNGPAAVAAIKAIRATGNKDPVSLITREPLPAYTPCFLADYVKRRIDLQRLYIVDEHFYKENNVYTYTSPAQEVDPLASEVRLADGQRVSYSRLLIATGACPVLPRIEGLRGKGVFTFKTLEDARAIDSSVVAGKRAVVIGGGFIGVEIAEALCLRGCQVTVIEKEPHILAEVLDPEMALMVLNHLQKKGVRVLTDITVHSVDRAGDGSPRAVLLEDGTTVACDLIVVATGISPEVSCVRNTAVRLNRGVLVDAFMRSSVRNIYAAGDVAEIQMDGRNVFMPIHPLAVMTGTVAGANMAGECIRLGSVPLRMNILRVFETFVCSIGEPAAFDVRTYRDADGIKKLFLDDRGVLRGLQMIGTAEKAGRYLAAIQKGLRLMNGKLPATVNPQVWNFTASTAQAVSNSIILSSSSRL